MKRWKWGSQLSSNSAEWHLKSHLVGIAHLAIKCGALTHSNLNCVLFLFFFFWKMGFVFFFQSLNPSAFENFNHPMSIIIFFFSSSFAYLKQMKWPKLMGFDRKWGIDWWVNGLKVSKWTSWQLVSHPNRAWDWLRLCISWSKLLIGSFVYHWFKLEKRTPIDVFASFRLDHREYLFSFLFFHSNLVHYLW